MRSARPAPRSHDPLRARLTAIVKGEVMDRWTIGPVSEHRVVARIDGDLDLANGRDLVDYLVRVIASSGCSVEVDLSGVEFIDSSGLQALINGHRLLLQRGSALTIVNPSACTRRLLELTGCTQIFRIVHREMELPTLSG